MAYETGAAATVDAILQKISTFALGLGYTINRDTTWATGRELCIYHADAGYFNMYSTNTIQSITDGTTNPSPWIYLYSSTGYDASAVSAQPGTSLVCITNGLAPDFHKYHLFGTTEYIHCVIEIQPGLFAHLGFGKLEQSWLYGGGQYTFGTYFSHSNSYRVSTTIAYHGFPFDSQVQNNTPNGQIRVDTDGISPRWLPTNRGGFVDSWVGSAGRNWTQTGDSPSVLDGIWNLFCTPNSINGIAPLMPCVLGAVFPTTGDKHYLIGKVKDIRHVNMELMTPSQIVTYGTDDWIMFPTKKKQLSAVTAPDFSSGTNGLAYRKV